MKRDALVIALACAAFSTYQLCDAQHAAILPEPSTGVGSTSKSSLSAPTRTVAVVEQEESAVVEEPFWGRVYLRHGVTPIQYFRDSFGGKMVDQEVEFVFPELRDENRFGCDSLGQEQESAMKAAATANRSMVLVVDRGECTFEVKSRHAEAAGAAGLVVINTDESAFRPVATVDEGEITIPSVMVRKSAGDQLRSIAARERVFGRLIPIVCTRKAHYACSPRSESEKQYVSETTTRSGIIVSSDGESTTIGEFMAATYGSILPSHPALPISQLLHSSVVCQNSDTEKMPRLDGKIALVAGGRGVDGDCSVLEIVSNAQLAGATAALVVVDNNKTVSMHPSVEENWHAYNITIFSGAISASTALQLVQFQERNPVANRRVHFELNNAIADAWTQIHKLSVQSAWPRRKERKEKFLKRILTDFALNESQTLALKNHFLTVGGGSVASWDALVQPRGEIREQKHDDELSGENGATTIAAKIADRLVAASASHEEL